MYLVPNRHQDTMHSKLSQSSFTPGEFIILFYLNKMGWKGFCQKRKKNVFCVEVKNITMLCLLEQALFLEFELMF